MSLAGQMIGAEAGKLDGVLSKFTSPFKSGGDGSDVMDSAVNDAKEADEKEAEAKDKSKPIDPAKEKEEAENKLVLDKIQLYFTTRSVCTDSNIKYVNRVISTMEKFGAENMTAYAFITTTRTLVKSDEKGAKK